MGRGVLVGLSTRASVVRLIRRNSRRMLFDQLPAFDRVEDFYRRHAWVSGFSLEQDFEVRDLRVDVEDVQSAWSFAEELRWHVLCDFVLVDVAEELFLSLFDAPVYIRSRGQLPRLTPFLILRTVRELHLTSCGRPP